MRDVGLKVERLMSDALISHYSVMSSVDMHSSEAPGAYSTLIKTLSLSTTRPAPSHHVLTKEGNFKAGITPDHRSTLCTWRAGPGKCHRTTHGSLKAFLDQVWIFTSTAHLTCSSRLLMAIASDVPSPLVPVDRDCNCFSMDILCSAWSLQIQINKHSYCKRSTFVNLWELYAGML